MNMNTATEQWLFEDNPNDFQLVGELIPCKSWEEEQKERLKKAQEKANREQPVLFLEEA